MIPISKENKITWNDPYQDRFFFFFFEEMQVDKDYSVPQVSPELVTRGQKNSANIHF